jgi:YbbR domain-containing protein
LTRLLRVVVHNWPLKIAAVVLASILYSGLVLSQDARTFAGVIPIQVVNQPADLVLPAAIEPVTTVRYYSADPSLQPSTSTFRATVDLSGVQARSGTVRVDVSVESVQPSRIQVLSWEPRFVTIPVDQLVSKDVPVRIERGTVPAGLQVGEPSADPSTVKVSGPASIVRLVVAARADVVIQSTGIDVHQDVPLVPVDALGDAQSPVDVEPATARISIPVFSDRQTRTVPVNPVVTGTPGAGFEIASVTVDPTTVTVQGDADALADLVRADTQPVSVSGATTTVTATPELALPDGIVAVGPSTAKVTVSLDAVTGTRSFQVGLSLVGARADRVYATSTDQVLLTVGGPVGALARLQGSTLVGRLDVAGLTEGDHELAVTASLPSGLTLVSVSPARVTVRVAAPTPTATPEAVGGSPAAPAEGSPTVAPAAPPSATPRPT